MRRRSYTEQLLREAIVNSTSIRQALLYLGLSGQGGNYRIIHRAIYKYNIDISHFTGQGWSKNITIGPKKDIKEYLVDGSTITSFKLKKRLIKEGILEPKCSKCLNETWLDGPIPLELDHINGKNDDNKLSNLRLLCPNCHSLTDTYRGRNRRKT